MAGPPDAPGVPSPVAGAARRTPAFPSACVMGRPLAGRGTTDSAPTLRVRHGAPACRGWIHPIDATRSCFRVDWRWVCRIGVGFVGGEEREMAARLERGESTAGLVLEFAYSQRKVQRLHVRAMLARRRVGFLADASWGARLPARHDAARANSGGLSRAPVGSADRRRRPGRRLAGRESGSRLPESAVLWSCGYRLASRVGG